MNIPSGTKIAHRALEKLELGSCVADSLSFDASCSSLAQVILKDPKGFANSALSTLDCLPRLEILILSNPAVESLIIHSSSLREFHVRQPLVWGGQKGIKEISLFCPQLWMFEFTALLNMDEIQNVNSIIEGFMEGCPNLRSLEWIPASGYSRTPASLPSIAFTFPRLEYLDARVLPECIERIHEVSPCITNTFINLTCRRFLQTWAHSTCIIH